MFERDAKHDFWAQEVKRRDNYVCQLCGAKGVYLHSHHLYSWDIFISKRYDLTNGVTLCQNCHKKFHLFFNSGSNTPFQFNYFTKIYKKTIEFLNKKFDGTEKKSLNEELIAEIVDKKIVEKKEEEFTINEDIITNPDI